jgi:hypothetical protein
MLRARSKCQRTADDAGNPVPPFSVRQAKLPPLLTGRMPRGLTLTGPDHGKDRMSVSKSNGPTTKKPVLWMVPARMGRKGSSAVCGVLKSASTLTLRAHTSAPRKRVQGVKITAV